MLTLGVQVFPALQNRLLAAASKAGEVVWTEGLRLSGNGLIEGIAGNGYAMHCLSRAYN